MFCTNCGNENPDNLNYCTNCGMSFNNAAQYQQFNSDFNNDNFSAMDAKKFRKLAREKLAGKWGNAALLMLVFGLCFFGIAFISGCIPLASIAFYIISPVLSFGLLMQWIKLKNGEVINYFDFFPLGFNNFTKVWGVQLRVWLKQIVPIIIMIVAYLIMTSVVILPIIGVDLGVIPIILLVISLVALIVGVVLLIPLQYKYMFCFNELAYDNNRSAKEIVEYSGNLMLGKRAGFFWLQLTFIGWIILPCLGYLLLLFLENALSNVLFALLGYLVFVIPSLWITPYVQIASILYYEWVSGRLGQGNVNTNTYANNDVNMDYDPYNSENN